MAGHAGRRRDHVLLRDPGLVKAIRVRQLERTDTAVGRKVGVEHDELGMIFGQLEQRLAVRLRDVLVRNRCSHAGA